MASNVEGEALKRISGAASQGGGLSALTGWLAGRGQRSGDSSGAKKTGIDYQNEETAKQHEFERQGTRRNWAQEDSSNPRYKEATYDTSGTVRTAYYPTSSGGQGTSGNIKGRQMTGAGQKKRSSGRPPRENKVPSVGSMTPSSNIKTAVEPSVSTPVKKTRATGKPKA